MSKTFVKEIWTYRKSSFYPIYITSHFKIQTLNITFSNLSIVLLLQNIEIKPVTHVCILTHMLTNTHSYTYSNFILTEIFTNIS